MNRLFILIFFTSSLTVFCCNFNQAADNQVFDNKEFEEGRVQGFMAASADFCISFFEQQIINENSDNPYQYSDRLKKDFDTYDINIKHSRTDKTIFEEVYLDDSKAAVFGLFIKNANFTKDTASSICKKLDQNFYLITDILPKDVRTERKDIIRINGKNYCTKVFDMQKNRIELINKDYFKDLFNPLGHQNIFQETFNKSKQKIKTLLSCFKSLDTQRKIKVHKNLIIHYFIPAILNERFESKFKEVNEIFIDFIDHYNTEQEKASIKTPINSTIQQFFLSGESIQNFNKNASTAFVNFVNQKK